MPDIDVESEHTIRRHGLEYRVRRVFDSEPPDATVFGEFVRDEAEDTIPVPEDVRTRLIGYYGRSIDDIPRWYRNQHLPAEDGERLRYAREDLQHVAAYFCNEWWMLGVVVDVVAAGITVGSASLWGIESTSDKYFEELERELMADALADARKTYGRMKAIPSLAKSA